MTTRQNALRAARIAALNEYETGETLLAVDASRIFQIAESTLYRELKYGMLSAPDTSKMIRGRRVLVISDTFRAWLDTYRRKQTHKRRSKSLTVAEYRAANPVPAPELNSAEPEPFVWTTAQTPPTLFDANFDTMSVGDLIALLRDVTEHLGRRAERLAKLEAAAASLSRAGLI